MNEDNKELTYEMIMQMFAEIAEDRKEINKQMKQLQKEIGGIGRRNGDMAVDAICGALERNMSFAGIKFDTMEKKVYIMNGIKTLTDIDVITLNCHSAGLIEIKYTIEKKDVNDLLYTKLKYFREYLPDYKDHKVVLAVAGMSIEEDAESLAKEHGIAIIKAIGDKVEYNDENIKIY
jgi:hypothetical protein